METNTSPAETVTGNITDAEAAANTGQTVEAATILYYYTSSGVNPCVHDLHSRQHLTFELSESDGTGVDIDDISNLCILLELK